MDGPGHLFVYGTLRPALGHPLSRDIERQAQRLGTARLAGRLYDLGRYPAVVPGAGARDAVNGELYRLHDEGALLRRLDAYEGCGPGFSPPTEYRREVATVRLNETPVRAWVYVYQLAVTRLRRIPSGDYVAYLGRRDL